MRFGLFCSVVPLSLIFNGCCCNSSQDGCLASHEVRNRTGQEVVWRKDCFLEQQARDEVIELLNDELTVDEAVKITLLNNPTIQSQFETIGISRAQYLSAITPRNPIGYWEIERQLNPFSSLLDIQCSVTGFLWDIFLIPIKRKAAALALRQQELQVAQGFLDLIFTVKTTFYQLQTAEEQLLIKELTLSDSESLVDSKNLAQQSHYQAALVDYLTSQVEVEKLREDLNQLMGFESSPDLWNISLTFPKSGTERLTLDEVGRLALCNRLELQNTRLSIYSLIEQQKLQAWWTLFDPQIGPIFEREPDETIEFGFALTHSIPIFNLGTAARRQISIQIRQLWQQYQMVKIQILSSVRLAYARLKKDEDLLEHSENQILPLINAGHDPNRKLDDDALDRILALEQQYSKLQRDYWIHRAELEHAVGGSLILHDPLQIKCSS